MGAAAGVVANEMPEGLKELFDLTERQKTKIAEIDAAMLDVEMGKLFKGHNKIIDDLTARSKSQLKFMFEKFPATAKHLEALVVAGNPYAKFIQQLAMPKLQIEMDLLKASEFDEELLVNLIGTSTTRELKELNDLYLQEKGCSIADTFATKGKDNASLVRVVQTIFRFLRDESKDIDQDLAERQAETIHKAGPMRLIGVDEDTFFDILLTTSRSQCYAINEAYQRLFKMKLERAINMKFRGNLSRLLVLWSMPPSSSIMTAVNLMTQRMLVDKVGVCSFLARYDKDTLKTVDAASKELQRKPFADLLGGALSGTQYRAVKGWIESASPDKGFDRIIQIYIDQKLNLSTTPSTLAELLTDPEMQNKLHFLLDKEAAEMKLFLIDHKVKVDPSDQAIMARSSASIGTFSRSNTSGQGQLRTSPSSNAMMSSNKGHSPKSGKNNALKEVVETEDDEEDETPVKISRPPPIKRKFSVIIIDEDKDKEEREAARHQLVNHTYTYLLSIFEDADVDAEGSLDTESFWETAKQLPLEALGFDVQEIDEIRANSAWEQENRVYYYEALMEFAESCVTSIQEKNSGGEAEQGNDVKQVIDALIAQKEAMEDRLGASPRSFHDDIDKLTMVATSSRRRSSVKDAAPEYFMHYIFDTVAAFDFNSSGRLGVDEITALVQTLNISTLTVDTFLSRINENNRSGEDKVGIEFKQASDLIVREVQLWFKDGQDHFICLVDKATGAYFWFNTKDESSQWVDNNSNAPNTSTDPAAASAAAEGQDDQLLDGKDITKVDSSDARAASLDDEQLPRASSSSSKKKLLAMSQSAPAIISTTEEAVVQESDAKGE